jgi:hypothetical protein
VPFGFGGHWIKAQGTVIAGRDTGSKALGTWRSEWVVEVYPQGEAPFRAPIKWPLMDQGFWPVSVGDTVHIEYEAGSHELRWDKADPATNLLAPTPDGVRAQQDRAFTDALAGRTPSPADPGSGALDPELQELIDLEAAAGGSKVGQAPGDGPATDGREGLSLQFDASGRPMAGQVEHVVDGVASGQLRTIRGKSDEILASGVHGTAVVTTASPLGKTVRDINPNADPSRLNDPMWLFTIQVSLPGQQPFPAVFGHRVPLAKLAFVMPGVRLAVAVNPADPSNEVAIDWDQSPLP